LIQILQLLAPINASNVFINGDDYSGGDDVWWEKLEGLTGASVLHENFPKAYDYYFAGHHNRGDTMTVLEPEAINLVLVLTAVVAYVLADMEYELPKAQPKWAAINEMCSSLPFNH
jgi:hypothetical protein